MKKGILLSGMLSLSLGAMFEPPLPRRRATELPKELLLSDLDEQFRPEPLKRPRAIENLNEVYASSAPLPPMRWHGYRHNSTCPEVDAKMLVNQQQASEERFRKAEEKRLRKQARKNS